jgi:uncharacterized membrane protein YkoI
LTSVEPAGDARAMTPRGKTAAAILAFTAACGAGSVRHAPEDLSKLAKIPEPQARKIALARVPGEVKSVELEREHDDIVYSYDIQAPSEIGVEEVQVDATTGRILSIVHETQAKEETERD